MSRRVFLIAMVVLVPSLSLVEGGAADPPPVSTVEQQWDLLAGARAEAVGGTVVDIYRGSFGGSALSPAPVVELIVVGYLSGAAGGGAWEVELRGGSNQILGVVQFTAQDDEPMLKRATIAWPSIATELASLKLVKYGSPLNPGGTLHMNKVYLRLKQTGTITATRGRVPLLARQTVSSSSWTDVADPILYKHSTQGLDPAASATLRIGGQGVSFPSTAQVRLIEVSAGTSAAEVTFSTSSPSSRTATATLVDGKTYRLQAKSSQVGWTIFSADLEFVQTTVDPRGLASVVAWYPMTTTATTLSANGVRTEHLIPPPVNDAELSGLDWITVAKRISGTGNVGADLVSSGASEPLGTGLTVASASYTLKSNPVPPPPMGSDWWDTRSALSAGTTGRLAGSLLRQRLRLRDTITALAMSRESFSPIVRPYDDRTQISGGIHPDAGQPTWRLTIVSEANEEVAQATGSGLSPTFTWDAVDPATGYHQPDGPFTVSLTLDGWPKVLRQALVTVDSSGPLIGRMSILQRDHGNTHYLSQPLLAKITDAGVGVDPASIRFTLLDETDQANRIEAVHPATSYDPTTGWAKTAPVTLQQDHWYRIEVEASDLLGNFGWQAQRSVRDSGGFLTIAATATTATAPIATTPCTVSGVNPTTQTRAVTCSSVPLALGSSSVTLSAAIRGSYGSVDHHVPLEGALLESTALGQPVSRPAYPPGATHTVGRIFTIEAPSWAAQTLPVPAKTVELGVLATEVPGTWSTNVTVRMPGAGATATFPTCADPTGSPGVMCLPDPAWAMYEVTVSEGSDPQVVADLHASQFGVTVIEVFDEGTPDLDQGYFAAMPYATAARISSEPDVETTHPKDRTFNDNDLVEHIEVRPPSGTRLGTADLRCAWHDVCGESGQGHALDWGGKTQGGGDVRASYFRAFGWAFERDAETAEMRVRQAPSRAGWILVSEGPNPNCIEQEVKVIADSEDVRHPGPPRYGAYYSHVEALDEIPGDPVPLDAGQAPPQTPNQPWGPPQFTPVRVGDEVSATNCNGKNHTHIDLMASTNSARDYFAETRGNPRVLTWEACEAATDPDEVPPGQDTYGCGTRFDMQEPETVPPGPDGGRMLALEAEHYPVFWWQWVDNPCDDTMTMSNLCQILMMDDRED